LADLILSIGILVRSK